MRNCFKFVKTSVMDSVCYEPQSNCGGKTISQISRFFVEFLHDILELLKMFKKFRYGLSMP